MSGEEGQGAVQRGCWWDRGVFGEYCKDLSILGLSDYPPPFPLMPFLF